MAAEGGEDAADVGHHAGGEQLAAVEHITSGGEALVALSQVGIRVPRRENPLVHGVSLRVQPGERVLLLGPSGSGKSSLLRTINGIVPHSVNAELLGQVQVAGVDTRSSSAVELSRFVGSLSQDPDVSVCLATVDAEVALPLENRAAPRAEIDGRIRAALRAVAAEDLIARPTGALSGGEVQRVALAATLAAGPQVLLLDEPTSMLDRAGVDAVRAAVADATADSNTAMFLVEHRLDEFAGPNGLSALPERTVVLSEGGEVVADGATQEVMLTHARALTAAGCWLPLEAELFAHTGVAGGLSSEANKVFLGALARRRSAAPGMCGPVVLSARDLSVSPGGKPIRAAGRGRRKVPRVLPVLTEADLDLHAGEIVALVGANGSGKSSLLLTLAALVQPAAGRVDGAAAGMVFQNPEYQFLTHQVRDEIGWGVQDEALVRRLLVEHRLEALAGQNPYRLSGGEKRRLSLAAMLASRDRAVLLADEPTFGLDRRGTIETARALRTAASRGVAICFSSHDLRLVAGLAHRVVALADGHIVADGPTAEVLADDDVMASVGLRRPPLVRYLLDAHGQDLLTVVLTALDELLQDRPGHRDGINETLISTGEAR